MLQQVQTGNQKESICSPNILLLNLDVSPEARWFHHRRFYPLDAATLFVHCCSLIWFKTFKISLTVYETSTENKQDLRQPHSANRKARYCSALQLIAQETLPPKTPNTLEPLY